MNDTDNICAAYDMYEAPGSTRRIRIIQSVYQYKDVFFFTVPQYG